MDWLFWGKFTKEPVTRSLQINSVTKIWVIFVLQPYNLTLFQSCVFHQEPGVSKLVSPKKTTVLSRPKLYFTIQTLVIIDSNIAASSVMATSAQHQNKVFFIVCFIRNMLFPNKFPPNDHCVKQAKIVFYYPDSSYNWLKPCCKQRDGNVGTTSK